MSKEFKNHHRRIAVRLFSYAQDLNKPFSIKDFTLKDAVSCPKDYSFEDAQEVEVLNLRVGGESDTTYEIKEGAPIVEQGCYVLLEQMGLLELEANELCVTDKGRYRDLTEKQIKSWIKSRRDLGAPSSENQKRQRGRTTFGIVIGIIITLMGWLVMKYFNGGNG